MKKTFLKAVTAAAVVAATMALSSVMAIASTAPSEATYVYYKGNTDSHIVLTTSNGTSTGAPSAEVTFTDGTYINGEIQGYKVNSGGDSFTVELKDIGNVKGSLKIYGVANTSGTLANNEGVSYNGESAGSFYGTKDAKGNKNPAVDPISISVNGDGTYKFTTDGKSTKQCRIVYVAFFSGADDSVNYPDFEKKNTDTNQDSGLSSSASKDANITGLAEGDTTGTLENPADTETIPGFTVYGGDKNGAFNGMTIDPQGKDINGTHYNNRLQTNGVGSKERYSISFDVEKDSTIEVIGVSGNSASYRPLVLSNGTKELAKHVFEGNTISTAKFSVTPGTYYLYAGPHTNTESESASDGGVNLYSIKIYDGASYVLPVVDLSTPAVVDDRVQITASVNDDFTAGEITAIGFMIAQPDEEAPTDHPCTYYKQADGSYTFIGSLPNKAFKAQAYVKYTSAADESEVTRYSNSVVNAVE